MSSTELNLELTIFTRPKKVVFFINPEFSEANNLIDEILKYSNEVWGGRFHAIVPTDGSDLTESWWNFIEVYDPDIICSFLKISYDFWLKINKKISPSRIETPLSGKSPLNAMRYLNQISIFDIPKHISNDFYIKPHFNCLIDIGENRFKSCILQNFGLLPNYLDNYRIDLIFDKLDNEIKNLSNVDINQLFNRKKKILADRRKIYDPIEINAELSPDYLSGIIKQEYDGVTIVIGDTPIERIHAWNLGKNSCWLPASLLDEPKNWKFIASWIHKNFSYSQASSKLKIISYSLKEDSLKNFAEFIKKNAYFVGGYKIKLFREFTLCKSNFKRNVGLHDEFKLNIDFNSIDGNFTFKLPYPPFLNPFKDNLKEQGWIIETKLTLLSDTPYGFGKIYNLPKKLGMAEIFLQQKNSYFSRITSTLIPAFEVSYKKDFFFMRIPSPHEIFHVYISREASNCSYEQKTPEFGWMHLSGQGRSLKNVIDLFGNLEKANNFFTDIFWRQVVLEMLDQKKEDQKCCNLTKIINDKLKGIDISQDLNAVSAYLADELRRSLPEREKLQISYPLKKIREVSQEGMRLSDKISDGNRDYWQFKKEMMLSELNYYIEKGIFNLGIKVDCPKCLYSKFYSWTQINDQLFCEGCSVRILPITELTLEDNWRLTLNTTLIKAIKYDHVLNLIQVLGQYNNSQNPILFHYLPCQDLFKKDQMGRKLGTEQPFSDIDILFIDDGKTYLGEVKTHSIGFLKEGELNKLRIIALDLSPDFFIIAANDQVETWPSTVKEKLDEFENILKRNKIEVVRIGLENWKEAPFSKMESRKKENKISQDIEV